MALNSVGTPQAGEDGYYNWHTAVDEAYKQLKAALDAAAAGDLLGADGNSDLTRITVIDGGTP